MKKRHEKLTVNKNTGTLHNKYKHENSDDDGKCRGTPLISLKHSVADILDTNKLCSKSNAILISNYSLNINPVS
jgi:hypothetical protein